MKRSTPTARIVHTPVIDSMTALIIFLRNESRFFTFSP